MKRSRTRGLVAAMLALSLALPGCAHQRTKRFETALSEGRCEAALENVPENDENVKYMGKAQRAGGTALSYAVTGAGYTADVVLMVAGGAVLFTALCGPGLIVAMAATGTGVFPSQLCIPADLDNVKTPTLGRDAYRSTASWRCPDLTALAHSVRRVSNCYEAKDDKPSLERAKQTLESVVRNEEFMGCITQDEASGLRQDLFRIDQKVRRL